MKAAQREVATGRAARMPVVQLALVALAVLALGWSWQRPALVQQQVAQPGPREPYITDLILPLDVGTLAQQVRGARGTARRPRHRCRPPRSSPPAQARGRAAPAAASAAGARAAAPEQQGQHAAQAEEQQEVVGEGGEVRGVQGGQVDAALREGGGEAGRSAPGGARLRGLGARQGSCGGEAGGVQGGRVAAALRGRKGDAGRRGARGLLRAPARAGSMRPSAGRGLPPSPPTRPVQAWAPL